MIFNLSRGKYLLLLLILSFLLRLGAVLALRDITRFHGPGPAGGDAVEFNAIALNLATGHGYAVLPNHPTSFRAPGFPLLLAPFYWLSYENYPLGYMVLCAVGALTCALTYYAAKELFEERLARIAGLILAVYFSHIYYATVFLSEELFGLCVAGGLWLFLVHLRTSSLPYLAGAGLAFGYSALTRPVGLLILPFLLVALLRASGFSLTHFMTRAAVFCAVSLLVVGIWTARNYAVHHKFVLIATNGGSTFYGANNDIVLNERKYRGSWISTVELPGRRIIEAAPNEVAHDQVEWALGKDWVRAHWKHLPVLCFYKLARLMLPEMESPNRKFVLIQTVTYVPFAILLAIGLAFCLKRGYPSAGWIAVHSIVAAVILNSLLFYGSARFRDAIDPVLTLYAAAGIQDLLRRFGSRTSSFTHEG